MPPRTSRNRPKKTEIAPVSALAPNVVLIKGDWYVRKFVTVKKNGASKRKAICRRCYPETAEQAKLVLASIESKLMDMRLGRSVPILFFGDIVRKFKASELLPATYSKDGKQITGRRSIATVEKFCDNLIQRFGDENISNITYGDLEDYKRERLNAPVRFAETSRPRSIRSVNYELGVLRQIFKFAIRRRWLDRSPFEDGKGLINPSAETRRYKTWTRDEEYAALIYSRKHFPYLYVVILCMVDAGFRRGELLNAKWSDFDGQSIAVRNYKGTALQIRRVRLSRRAIAALRAWKRLQRWYKCDRSRIIGYNKVQKSWAAVRSHIKRDDLRLHDLRHVFGTRLADNQVPLHQISRVLGHSDLSTTQIYLSPDRDTLDAVTDVIDRLNDDII